MKILLKDKIKLSALTLFVDLGFIYGLYYKKLNLYDKIFSACTLTTHSIFLYYLYKQNKKKLDLLHCFIPILLIGSTKLTNPLLIFSSLTMLSGIQILWVIEERCILNDSKDTWGFTKSIQISAILLTILLSVKLGYNVKKV